ncbi:DUF2142 domain-containing protein [Frankia sp. CNm7]|uniref:DUF2142 domain-containing protein n=1 Tax=Frankia nepalensis TaxID=1836974 RepID=A0A937UP48_9ACTN|nr:DUF2142 domain-containing protein [Frankia nepalensis]MBL7514671.1 DUF2142 domain-containing protein [Frankia nepalensis]MBL7524578.1 DUF2142 domain-containing protein [Frankia nepalensis]MBL7630494.1 DUF2142 domain-containing protein [Frankia nepalensis]
MLRPEVRFRPWRVLRSAPAPVWLITILFTLLLGSWSVLVPQYHAPDEPHHVDAVMRLAEGKGWPPVGHATASPETVGSIVEAPYGTRDNPRELAVGPFTEADATDRADRPEWRELPRPGQPAGDVQQMMQHPPLYYLAGAALVKLPPGAPQDLRFDLVIGLLRLMSVLMVAPLPLIAWAAAERITESRAAGRVAALLPLAIPMLTHIGSSVNNDALLVLAGALTTLALCYVLRGDTSARTGCWVGAFIGIAMLSKSLGIVFVPLAVVAYLLAWRRARGALAREGASAGEAGALPAPERTRADGAPFLLAEAAAGPAVSPAAARFPWRPLLTGTVAALAFGAWWFVVNLVRYHTFQPTTPGFVLGTELSGWGEFADVLVNGTILRWWGEFGWFEANLPELAARIGTVVVAVLAAVGIAAARPRARRVDLVLMLWPTAGLFGLMTLQSGLHFHDTSHASGISGRYLFAGLVALAVGVGAGAASAGRLSRFTPLVMLAGAVAMQAMAICVLFPRWWEGPGGDARDGLDALLAWSPWPPVAVEVVLGLCALTLLAVAVWAVVFAIRPVPRDPGERDAGKPGAMPLADLIAGNVGGPAGPYDWFGTGAHPLQPDAGTPQSDQTLTIPRRPGAHRHRKA